MCEMPGRVKAFSIAMRAAWIAAAVLAACSGGKSATPSVGSSPTPSQNPNLTAVPTPTQDPVPDPNPTPTPDPTPIPDPTPTPTPTPPPGADFTAEAKLLHRIVACGGDAPLADPAIAKVV